MIYRTCGIKVIWLQNKALLEFDLFISTLKILLQILLNNFLNWLELNRIHSLIGKVCFSPSLTPRGSHVRLPGLYSKQSVLSMNVHLIFIFWVATNFQFVPMSRLLFTFEIRSRELCRLSQPGFKTWLAFTPDPYLLRLPLKLRWTFVFMLPRDYISKSI